MEPERAKFLIRMLEEIETARFSPSRPQLRDLEKRLQTVRGIGEEGRSR